MTAPLVLSFSCHQPLLSSSFHISKRHHRGTRTTSLASEYPQPQQERPAAVFPRFFLVIHGHDNATLTSQQHDVLLSPTGVSQSLALCTK